jgi:hypothetical protein
MLGQIIWIVYFELAARLNIVQISLHDVGLIRQ